MEIAIVARAKQGYIYRYMKERGMTVLQLAKEIGLPYPTMINLINFRYLPPRPGSLTAQRLEAYFHIPTDILFPPELENAVRERMGLPRVIYREIDPADLISITDVDQRLLTYKEEINFEEKDLLDKLLAVLNPRERHVIEQSMIAGETLRDIAKQTMSQYQWIQIIQHRALNKMRFAARHLSNNNMELYQKMLDKAALRKLRNPRRGKKT